MSEKKLKAYKIHCRGDHGAEILFGGTAKQFRGFRTDACDCEYLDLWVHRAPEFDDLAPGPVKIADYLARGWYWHCCTCGGEIYEEDTDAIIMADAWVFCGPECFDRDLRRARESVTAESHPSMIRFLQLMETESKLRAGKAKEE